MQQRFHSPGVVYAALAVPAVPDEGVTFQR